MYDVIVIGLGPAGMSAAINVRQRGGTVLAVGTAPENNPLWRAEQIDNYPGLPGKTGSELMQIFIDHAKSMGTEIVEERVLNAFPNGDTWMISAGSEVYEAYSIVFAGGIVRGKKFPGEEEHIGRGVSYCATCDGMLYRGKRVAVIGFGPADVKEADYLTGIGCETVYLPGAKKVEIFGEGQVEKIVADGKEEEVSCVFILRPSVAPNSLFPGIELDGNFIKTDKNMETNIPGLFAAGDCTGTPLQVANAVGEGLVAGQKAMARSAALKKEKGMA